MQLIDGGLSTELERIGVDFGGELWTGRALLSDPSGLVEAHRNYATAGASVITTASYQLSRQGFEEIGFSADDADQALINSVAAARLVATETGAKVAASVGPYGAVLHDGSEYRGNYDVSQEFLERFHQDRIAVLLSAKPDFLAVETIPNVVEARALTNVLSKVDVPYWFSFTAGTSTNLWSGESVEEGIRAVTRLPNLLAVGFNCVNPDLIVSLAREARKATDLPLIIYPNKGGEWDSENGVWLNGQPLSLASRLTDWQDLGIGYIGGCCGNNATDIAELAQALRRRP